MIFDREEHDHFAELFVRNQARVYRYIVMLVPNRADADELFQETNLTLWKRWDSYDRSRDFLPWACKIAMNHVRNFWRKRQHVPLVFDEDLLLKLSQLRIQEDEMLERRQRALADCLAQLKPHQRQAVERYYATSNTIRSTACEEGRSIAAVYKMLEGIRAILHDCIDRKLAAEA